VIFGEALFDHFPDGSRVLGGAPFNVAWHLRGFGADPLLITSVGQDPEGQEILERMGSWEMDTSGVQVHPTKPTGRVTAHLKDGQPTFEIEADQAFDGINPQDLPAPSSPSLLYFGSLCLREDASAATLAHLRETLEEAAPRVPTLVDVNLRAPWWERDRVRRHIRGVDWLKVNDEEVGLLTGRPVNTESEIMEAAQALKSELGIGNVVVTLGSQGAVALPEGEPVRVEGRKLPEIVDTVGAGDAFTSVLALGIHGRWPPEILLRRASAFAGEICMTRGATSPDPAMYLETLREWTHAT
jgi:fructokinase